MQRKEGLAARAGRWSARHRAKAIAGWLAFVVLATLIGGAIGTKQIDDVDAGSGDSRAADQALDAAFPERSSEVVLVQNQAVDATSPQFKAVVRDVESALREADGTKRVKDPYETPEASISPDGHSVLVDFELDGGGAADPDYEQIVEGPLDAVAVVSAASSGYTVEEFGDASAGKALSESFANDFQRAETTSLPITLIILILAFGALVAAFVPLLLAATAVVAAIGLLAPLSQVFPVDEAVGSVILLIGLAVGVDYSMFYLRREREERARGASKESALEAAAATSGRAVLVSGVTVVIAMAGMYLAGDSTFTSFASGTILVVAIAVLGSLTVLPAVLSKLGDRVNKGRIPFLRSPEERVGREPRLWGAVLNRVLRRPKLCGGLAAALLLVMAIPLFGMKMAVPGIDSLPQDLPVIKTYDRIEAAFPGQQIPATVALEANGASQAEVTAAIDEIEAATAADPRLFEQPIDVEASPDGSVVKLDVPIAGDGTDQRSENALAALRDEILPAAMTAAPGAEAHVTGFTAGSVDFNHLMSSRMPLVFGFVLGAAFLLLLATFRSIVIPIKAILLNLLSVGAAYGLVVWIFQDGHLQSLLGFESSGAITSWLPMFMFVVLFGLSMDYHVFILSRIREAYERGMPSGEAVGYGIKSTASVVTAAAVVMVAVFSIFATLSALEFKQFGVGLAAAILIDATIVRGVLLPATMKLLGDWNWYLPSWLEWLPRIGAGHGVEPVAVAQVSGDGAEPELEPEPQLEREPVEV